MLILLATYDIYPGDVHLLGVYAIGIHRNKGNWKDRPIFKLMR